MRNPQRPQSVIYGTALPPNQYHQPIGAMSLGQRYYDQDGYNQQPGQGGYNPPLGQGHPQQMNNPYGPMTPQKPIYENTYSQNPAPIPTEPYVPNNSALSKPYAAYNQNPVGHSNFASNHDGNNALYGNDLLSADCDVSIRHKFICKVYGIVFCQLALTFSIVFLALIIPRFQGFIKRNTFIMIISMIAIFVILCTLTCIPTVGRKYPLNYILLFLLAFAYGFLVAGIAVNTAIESVCLAVALTTFIVLCLTLFAFQTHFDFTGCGPYLFVFAIVVLILGLVSLIFHFKILHMVYIGLGTLLTSFYLVYDTQLIVGGKNRKNQLSIDDYAYGALSLYVDIITLFLYILSLLSAIRDD